MMLVSDPKAVTRLEHQISALERRVRHAETTLSVVRSTMVTRKTLLSVALGFTPTITGVIVLIIQIGDRLWS